MEWESFESQDAPQETPGEAIEEVPNKAHDWDNVIYIRTPDRRKKWGRGRPT